MSADMVDDLHAAEEYGETLRVAVRRVMTANMGMATSDTEAEWEAANTEYVAAMSALDVASEERFVRPGCEEFSSPNDPEIVCLQGNDCGGYHPWAEDDS